MFKAEVAIQSPGKPSPTLPVDLLAPQLRLDADGNIVLDESSLVVALPETAREDNSVRHVNEETGLLNVTYNSFRTLPDRRGRRWSPRETVRFYRALNTFGRDFYLMATIFPNRSRVELKVCFRFEFSYWHLFRIVVTARACFLYHASVRAYGFGLRDLTI